MAEVQDIDGEVGEIEAVEKQIEQAKPDLPEKYRGKSVDDVVRMHQEAEKLIERQGREVGEVRKLADELIKSQLTPKVAPEKPEEIDFFADPQEATRRMIENNPRVIAAENYARQVQTEQTKQQFARIHPDATQIVRDADFQNWIGASKVRQKLFAQADAYDLEAADELLSTYKELRSVKQRKVDEVDTAVREQSLKAAAVDTGGSGESGRKIYRRADLIRLKMRDPVKYESMSDDILEAYRTGRVK